MPCTLVWHSRTLEAMNTKVSRSLPVAVGAANDQVPNPSIERTSNGLRPSAAAHVKR